MNKQVSYLTSAHLILLGLAAGYFMISKISFSPDDQSHESYEPISAAKNESVLSEKAVKGKSLFLSRCATCHNISKNIAGTSLAGFEERGPWSDRKQLYKWIRNPQQFMEKDPYTKALKEKFGSLMTAFPNLTDDEIDLIVEYINLATPL